MYAACLFFKMGGNFVRLVAAARQAVDKAFILRRGSPPQWIQTRNAELWDYLLTNWPVGRTMGSSRYSWPRRGLHQHNNELQHFFKVFNGEAFAVHYDNCSVVDCAAVKKAMVRGVTQVLLRAQPVPPNEGKWTKIGPCLEFLSRETCCRASLPCATSPMARSGFGSSSRTVSKSSRMNPPGIRWQASAWRGPNARCALILPVLPGMRLIVSELSSESPRLENSGAASPPVVGCWLVLQWESSLKKTNCCTD